MSHAISRHWSLCLVREECAGAQLPGREIYRLIRAFGFASRRDSVVRSRARTRWKTEPKGSASIQCPYSLRSYVTERYLDTGAYTRGRWTRSLSGTKRYADEGSELQRLLRRSTFGPDAVNATIALSRLVRSLRFKTITPISQTSEHAFLEHRESSCYSAFVYIQVQNKVFYGDTIIIIVKWKSSIYF